MTIATGRIDRRDGLDALPAMHPVIYITVADLIDVSLVDFQPR
jgi:hypothetical protein